MPRFIFDVTPEVQMAIRLAALKRGITTGEVVAAAVEANYPDDVAAARTVRAAEPTETG